MAIIWSELILVAGGGGISDIILMGSELPSTESYMPCILSVQALHELMQNPLKLSKIEEALPCFGSLIAF